MDKVFAFGVTQGGLEIKKLHCPFHAATLPMLAIDKAHYLQGFFLRSLILSSVHVSNLQLLTNTFSLPTIQSRM